MSLLSMHRSSLMRERDCALADQKKIDALGERIGRKKKELGRASSTAQIDRISRQLRSLEDDRTGAEKNLTAHKARISDLETKIAREEVAEQKSRDRALEQTQESVDRRLDDTSIEVGRLSDRVAAVEDALMERVREAVAEDPVQREHDVFLSHTGDDEDVARELYAELTARDLDVWFDGAELDLGKPTARQIDRGIARSRVGVVLVTEAFVKGRYWTEMEFSAFISSRKRLIPVLDGVGRADLSAYSPMLADLKGLDTEREGFDEIAVRIAAALAED